MVYANFSFFNFQLSIIFCTFVPDFGKTMIDEE